MTEWSNEEKRALRGRGLSRWLGDMGESLRSIFYVLFRILQLLAEGSVFVAFIGCVLSIFGVSMTWTSEECAFTLVFAVMAVFVTAGIAESLKK